MNQLTTELTFEVKENTAGNNLINPPEVRLIESSNQTNYIFYRNQLLAQYQKNDNYARNIAIVQLALCYGVSQKNLSRVFQLTVQHISTLVCKYRQNGSAGIQDRTVVRIGNNQKIKGKIANEIVKQLSVAKEKRPTYTAVAKLIKQKYNIQLSSQRISCWWRTFELENQFQQNATKEPEQMTLPIEGITQAQMTDKNTEQNPTDLAESIQLEEEIDSENNSNIEDEWQPNNVAGSFILYAMLNASQFLKPFINNLKKVITTGSKTVERVMLTLFFMHALRLKSIEQTKHICAAHFGPLVLGSFCRLQSLRYAIDAITKQKHFDKAIAYYYPS